MVPAGEWSWYRPLLALSKTLVFPVSHYLVVIYTQEISCLSYNDNYDLPSPHFWSKSMLLLLFKRKLRQTFLFLSIREKLLPVSWYFAHAQGSPSNTGKLGLGGEVIISDFERTDCKTVFNHSLTCCFECLISFIGTFSCLSSGVVSLSAFAL